MCRAQCVLVVALLVGLAHSWDIALTVGNRIEFYNDNGGKIETAYLTSQNLGALAYDEVHNMLLYVDKQSNNDAICGYNMTSKQNKCYVERNGRNIQGLAFDPFTETLFFTDTNERSINSFSFKHGYKNNVYGNLLIKLDYEMPTDIAVDSCRGYVYWINKKPPSSTIDRVRFDGSGREVVIDVKSKEDISATNDIHSVAIDQQSRTLIWLMPWTRADSYTYSADLNGQNKKSIITWGTGSGHYMFPNAYAFSKRYLFAVGCSNCPTKLVLKHPKPDYNRNKIIDVYTPGVVAIAINYKMDDQFQGISECSHVLNNFCVHGTKVNGQLLCKCTPGYTGGRCEISVCKNYCSNGNCSFTEQGLPTCRCKAGYSGERCDVDVCHEYCSNSGICSLNNDGQPICKCQGHYVGHKCEIFAGCLNYCFKGNCSYTEQGHRTCRCEAGYSGERCEVNVCKDRCLNNGTCSLDGDRQPFCQCQGHYVGHRCEISVCRNYCFKGNCIFTKQPSCRCEAGYSGERCEVNVCNGYCVNNGICALNEEDDPICDCVGEYEGNRCEVCKVHNQPACRSVGSHEDSGRKTDKNQTISTSSFNLGDIEKSLTLADLLENWRQHNNI